MFKKHPLQRYVLDDDYLVVDITREVGSTYTFDNPDFFIEYEIQDGDTPIILADKLYGDPQLDWTILLFNKIISYYDEWPLDYNSLINYIQNKYTDVHAINHYKSISTGNKVNGGHPDYDKIPVTNFEYEVEINDNKRKIKLITSNFIGEYVKAHSDKVEINI
ncbi:MAG: baseplate wedge protein 53 [Nitrosopumilaceae archaeon]|nr:baseplate wedge protein 53 [Nitrosopumilaceae archaeon]